MCTQKNGILEELAKLPITEDIKSIANSVYLDLNIPSTRQDNRKRAVCFSIYQAYIDSGHPTDMPFIVRMVGDITLVQADGAINRFWPKLKGKHKSRYITIYSLIDCYSSCEEINLTKESIDKIKDNYRKYKSTPNNKDAYKDRCIVAALIWCFIKENGESKSIDDEEYASIFGYRPVTIMAACKEVTRFSDDQKEKELSTSKLSDVC